MAKARSDGMRGFVVVPYTPSDPTWRALATASLTSVDGQRDPCIVLSDPAAYVLEGDDLGGAQRLAVMSADGASVRQWGSRRRVAGTQSAGRCSHFRASWTQRTVSAPQWRSRGSASQGAVANARDRGE